MRVIVISAPEHQGIADGADDWRLVAPVVIGEDAAVGHLNHPLAAPLRGRTSWRVMPNGHDGRAGALDHHREHRLG